MLASCFETEAPFAAFGRLLAIIIAIGLGGCAGVQPATGAPQTVVPKITGTSPAGSAPSATEPPSTLAGEPKRVPGMTATPALAPSATPLPQESSNCLRASFVQDVTLRDGSLVRSGSILLKIWRIRNSGECAWDRSLRLIFIGGDPMSGPDGLPAALFHPGFALDPELGDDDWHQARMYAVAPGETVDVPIFLRAPDEPGRYQSTWGLAAEGADRPAITFYLDIEVLEAEGEKDSSDGWEGLWDHLNARKGEFSGRLAIARAGGLYQGFFYAEGGRVYLLEGRSVEGGQGLEGVVGEPYEDGQPFKLRFLSGKDAFQGVIGEGEFAAEAWCGSRPGLPLPRQECRLR